MTVQVSTARSTIRKRLAHTHSSDRNGINLAALTLVPSSNQDSSRHIITLLVACALEELRSNLHLRRCSRLNAVHTQLVDNSVSNHLRIGSRTRPTAIDVVCDASQLVRDTVRDVCAVGLASIGTDDDTAVIFACHGGGTGGLLAVQPIPVRCCCEDVFWSLNISDYM